MIEVSVRIPSGEQAVGVVADAFCGAKGSAKTVADRPELLGTFRKFGVGDRPVAWGVPASAVHRLLMQS